MDKETEAQILSQVRRKELFSSEESYILKSIEVQEECGMKRKKTTNESARLNEKFMMIKRKNRVAQRFSKK